MRRPASLARRLWALVALAGTALPAARGRAQTTGSVPEAGVDPGCRRPAGVGLEQHRAGAYTEAIRSFEAALARAPAPVLRYNLALSHRLRGDCREAVDLYRCYLAAAPP